MTMIGMTGNRDGISEEAVKSFHSFILRNKQITSLSHGDCVGADETSHHIAVYHGLKTIIHPPIKTDLRAYCEGNIIHKPKGYFARNRDIVDTTKLLCGFPKINTETKGGTWYTINYAKNRNSPLKIFWPDGTVSDYYLR